MTEYNPWEEMGIDECEYWKRRYLEAREESFKIHEALMHVLSAIRREREYGMGLCCSENLMVALAAYDKLVDGL